MKKRIKTKTAIFMLFMLICFFIQAMPLQSARCEAGFFRCIEDPFWASSYLGTVYCLNGYVFCKKYVE